MKKTLTQHTQYITQANSEGTISIQLKVVIRSVLDDRVKEEEKQLKIPHKV